MLMRIMKTGLITLGLIVTLTGMADAQIARAVAPPVVPPYAPDRKLLATAFFRLEWNDAARNRDIPVKIYFPTEGDGPFPVVILSHGLGGTREAYEYLGRQWAANGYISIHLQHEGSDDSAWRGQTQPMQSMRQAANLQNASDRPRDVRYAIDQLESMNKSNDELKGKIDTKKIGVAGHSFGAQTALLIAGQQLGPGLLARRLSAGLSDDRVLAVIPMSAPVPAARNNLAAAYALIHVPALVMTGTKDDSPLNDTTAAERRIPYDQMKGNKAYLLTFEGGDHMVFSGRLVDRPSDKEFQEQIRTSSTAFWDDYLKDDAAARQWLDEGGFKKALGKLGTFEQK